MTIYTLMNTIEAIASGEFIDFYDGDNLVASLELGNHDTRYYSFMYQFGFDTVKSMRIDAETLSYSVRL